MKTLLDDIDWKILAELQQDGRMTNVELSRRVGISAPPCLRRVRALEEAGIIRGYRTLLDEIMARYLYAKGMNAVTARLEVRYNKPTPIGVPLLIKGRITKGKGRLYETEGTIELPDGTVTAQSTAKVFVIDPS